MTLSKSDKDLQTLGARLVSREIYICQSGTMDLIMRANADYYDDLENAYDVKCPECGETHDADAEVYDADDLEDEDGLTYDARCSSCGHRFDNGDAEQEPKEIYEWWAVSAWLADKLSEKGEAMFDGPDCKIWGRCATGQAIALDHVIQTIASEVYTLTTEGEA